MIKVILVAAILGLAPLASDAPLVQQVPAAVVADPLAATAEIPIAAPTIALGGLFNRGAADADVTVRWSDLKIPAPRRVRDLWAQANVAAIADSYTTRVPSHDVALLLVTP